jgi:LEA14-like dessication related protein
MRNSINKTMKWGCLLALLFVFSACSVEKVEFKGIENLKLVKLESRNLSLTFEATISNPNKSKIKVKPSNFDLYINGSQVGIAHIDNTIEFQKASESTVTVPVTVNVMQGAIPKILAGALMKTATVRIVGKFKGSMYGFTKGKKIDETKEISLRELNRLF